MRTIKNIWYKLSIKRKLMLFFSLIIICISLLNLYTLFNAFKYLKQVFKFLQLDMHS